jgi:hypothetical protein
MVALSLAQGMVPTVVMSLVDTRTHCYYTVVTLFLHCCCTLVTLSLAAGVVPTVLMSLVGICTHIRHASMSIQMQARMH